MSDSPPLTEGHGADRPPVRTLIHLPRQARRGEVVRVQISIAHPMETGYRPGADGQVLPRDLIRQVVCRYGPHTVLRARLHPAVAANPYLAFEVVAQISDDLVFEWTGDHGFSHTERVRLTVV